MACIPELSLKSSCTLRRIAWSLGIPMTQPIERVFEHLPRILDRGKCQQCAFYQSTNNSQKGGDS